MADDDLAALERTERDAWEAYQYACADDYDEERDAWYDALTNLNSARIALARRDG